MTAINFIRSGKRSNIMDQSQFVRGNGSIMDSATSARSNSNRKLTRVVFSVIAAFVLCWAPNQILNLIYLLHPVYATKHYFIIFTKVSVYIVCKAIIL